MTQDRHLHLLLQQFRLTEESLGSAPAAILPTSPSWPGLREAIAASAQSARPQKSSTLSGTQFWSTSGESFCRRWKQGPPPAWRVPNLLQPPAARLSQEPVSVLAHSPHFLVTGTRKFPPSEAGNYPGSILSCQQHILGAGWEEGGYMCQFVAIETCPASMYQALRPCHLG